MVMPPKSQRQAISASSTEGSRRRARNPRAKGDGRGMERGYTAYQDSRVTMGVLRLRGLWALRSGYMRFVWGDGDDLLWLVFVNRTNEGPL